MGCPCSCYKSNKSSKLRKVNQPRAVVQRKPIFYHIIYDYGKDKISKLDKLIKQ